MVKQNLAGGPRQGGQVNFLFRVVATVGFVSTYTSRSESHCVALYFKYTFCVELWLSLRRGTYRGTVTCLPVLHLIRYMLSFSCSYSSYTIPNIPGSQYLEYVDPRNVLLLL